MEAINLSQRPKTAIHNKFDFKRMKKHPFNADNKLQIEQIKRKLKQSSISHYLFENQIILKLKTTVSFRVTN